MAELAAKLRRSWTAVATRRTALGLALFFSVFWLYLAGGSREPPWGDARPIYEVAEALVQRGAVSIETRWPPGLPLGRDKKIQAISPLLPALVHVPGALVRHNLLEWANGRPPPDKAAITALSLPLCAHLAPAALGALTCLLFFSLCGALGVSRGMALWGTAAVGFATIVAVYARSPYPEIVQCACFTGFFARLLRVRRSAEPWGGVALGSWAGALLAAKLSFAGSVGGALVLVAWAWRRDPRALGRLLAAVALGFLPWLVAMLLYNWARWGSFTFGPGGARHKIWIGLAGQLFSPGKSVFLYAPPLLLTLFVLHLAWARCRDLLLVILVTVGPALLASASLVFWGGDHGWGPRHLVFAVPVLLLPAVIVFDARLQAARGWTRHGLRALLGTALAVGLFVQVLGSAFRWDHWLRVASTATERWLGRPAPGAQPLLSPGVGCGACFEPLNDVDWLPIFQPIVGHWWLAKHAFAGHDWSTAEKDAPWHTYTTLRLDIRDAYPVGRADWWMLDNLPARRGTRTVLLGSMCVLGLLSIVLLARTLRAAGPPLSDRADL